MDTQQHHHPQLVQTAPPPPAPPVPVRVASTNTPKPKAPPWWAKPQILAVVGLVLVLIELVAFGLLGWIWWLVANAALAVMTFLVMLAWRRRSKGGLIAKLLGARSRRPRTGRPGSGTRTGGRGGGRWPGMGGRGRSGTAGGGGLRSRLAKALGGAKGRGTAAGGPATGRSSGGLLGRLGRRASGTPSGSSARGPGSILGRKRNRGTGGTGGTGGGSGAGTAGKSKSRTSWWRRQPSTKPGPSSAGGPGRTTASKPAQEPVGRKPGQQANGDPRQGRPTPQRGGGDQQQSRSRPAAGPNSTGGSDQMTDMQYSADQSLQRAGANLRGAEEAAAEVQRLYAQAEAAKQRFTQVFGAATQQMEDDMPSSSRLRAEMETTQRQAQRATTADEWRAVSAQAATLPATYRQEHETDEDRLAGGRGGRHRERRADVAYAEQDN